MSRFLHDGRRLPRGAPPVPSEQPFKRHLTDDPHGLPAPIAGFCAADVLGQTRRQRFLRVDQAAQVMQLHPDELLELVADGLLESISVEGRLLVEPAIVTGGRMVDHDERQPR